MYNFHLEIEAFVNSYFYFFSLHGVSKVSFFKSFFFVLPLKFKALGPWLVTVHKSWPFALCILEDSRIAYYFEFTMLLVTLITFIKREKSYPKHIISFFVCVIQRGR